MNNEAVKSILPIQEKKDKNHNHEDVLKFKKIW